MAKEKSNRVMIALLCSFAIFPHTDKCVCPYAIRDSHSHEGNLCQKPEPYSNSHEIDVVEDKVPYHYRCSPRTNHL